MQRRVLVLLALCGWLFWAFPAGAQIKIDGVFFDWKAKNQLDVAPHEVGKTFAEGGETVPPRGSANPSYYADLDLHHVFAADDADFVYVRVQLNSIANVTNVPTDTSYHGGGSVGIYISVDPGPHDTTGLTWGWWGSGYDFLLQVYPGDSVMMARSGYPQPLWAHKQTGNGWDFDTADTLIGCRVQWNAANNDVEVAIPKSLLFHPKFLTNFTYPDSIAIMAFASENNSPWRGKYLCDPGVKGYMLPIQKPGIVTIDGLFFDWKTAWQSDVLPHTAGKSFADGGETDPPRGSTDPTYFADLDIVHLYATDDADFIYARVKMNPIANVEKVATDTSYHGGGAIALYISVDPGPHDTTGLTWGWWGSGYDFFVQAYPADTAMQRRTGYQQAVWEHSQQGNGWDFTVADTMRGAWVSWNASNNDVEFAIPKAILFNPKNLANFHVPDSIMLMGYAGENNSPWRAKYLTDPGITGYPLKLSGTTGIRSIVSSVPKNFGLAQNFPNPFNPSTTIRYAVPEAGQVTLKVYNLLGQEVATLVNGMQYAGIHVAIFDASRLTSGVYFCRLEASGMHDTQKMLLLK